MVNGTRLPGIEGRRDAARRPRADGRRDRTTGRDGIVARGLVADDALLEAGIMVQSYDWEGALDACSRVLRVDPDHVGALEVQAQALWFGGRFSDVVRVTTRLLHLNPYEPGYRYTRGMANLSLGDLAGASVDFQNAIEQSKDASFRAQVSSALEAVLNWMGRAGREDMQDPATVLAVGATMPNRGVQPFLRPLRPN